MTGQSTVSADRAALTEKVIAWLEPRAAEMEALLKELVNIDSNSFDKVGTDAVGEHIAKLLTGEGITVTRIAKADFGELPPMIRRVARKERARQDLVRGMDPDMIDVIDRQPCRPCGSPSGR